MLGVATFLVIWRGVQIYKTATKLHLLGGFWDGFSKWDTEKGSDVLNQRKSTPIFWIILTVIVSISALIRQRQLQHNQIYKESGNCSAPTWADASWWFNPLFLVIFIAIQFIQCYLYYDPGPGSTVEWAMDPRMTGPGGGYIGLIWSILHALGPFLAVLRIIIFILLLSITIFAVYPTKSGGFGFNYLVC